MRHYAKVKKRDPNMFEDPAGNLRFQTQNTGTVPTNRHTTIPSASGPVSVRVDDDPKL
jgi:hypothetical protein